MDTFKLKFTKFETSREFTVDFSKLPAVSQQYVVEYGMRQSLADSYVSAGDAAEFDALLSKRYDAIMAGTVGIRTRETDPLAREAKRYAGELIDKALAKKKFKATAQQRNKLISDYIEANRDAVEKEAKRRLKAQDVELDIVIPDPADAELEPGDEPEEQAAA